MNRHVRQPVTRFELFCYRHACQVLSRRGCCSAGGVAGSRMAGCITLSGRSKDTIVLSNGENIEPQPIEDACCVSPYISHMVVVGQDRRVLGALIAANADAFEELESVRGEPAPLHPGQTPQTLLLVPSCILAVGVSACILLGGLKPSSFPGGVPGAKLVSSPRLDGPPSKALWHGFAETAWHSMDTRWMALPA